MNYLAHAYLSFHQPEILAGNMVSDFVKGKKKFDYPELIQKGITLHRQIDQFTDDHPVTREAKEVFHASYRLYSGAFVDVTYDHFLANDTSIFADSNALMDFSQSTYRALDAYISVCPERFQKMFPYMRADNWLYHYQFTSGIKKSYQGLVHRAAYLDDAEPAMIAFKDNYYFLEDCYRRFFPLLCRFTLENFPG